MSNQNLKLTTTATLKMNDSYLYAVTSKGHRTVSY